MQVMVLQRLQRGRTLQDAELQGTGLILAESGVTGHCCCVGSQKWESSVCSRPLELPPSRMSVPRPAMLVAMVMASGSPA